MSLSPARSGASVPAVLAARSGRLRADLADASRLDSATRDALWRLFSRYYLGVTRADFEKDLGEKDHVIILRDDGDASLRGMSTLKVYDLTVQGRTVQVVFSGDTVIDAEYWGQSALHWAFLRYLVRVKLAHPFRPVCWFLISKGYKTYLLLARNFPRHYPRHDRPTPAWEQALIDSLARERYGAAYDAASGLLRFADSHGRLGERVAPITPELLAHPEVRFFSEKNPLHADGQELCCLGYVDLAFASYGALRVLKRPFRARQAT